MRRLPKRAVITDFGDLSTLLKRTLLEVENLRSFVRRYQTLFGFSLAVNEAMTDLDKLLDLILIAAIDEQRLAETGSVFLIDDDSGKLVLKRKRGKSVV